MRPTVPAGHERLVPERRTCRARPLQLGDDCVLDRGDAISGVTFKGKRPRDLADDAAVSVRGVRKSFRSPGGAETRVLDDIDLDIRRGEFFSLLGPSGCGKTTLLRILAGFESPDAGAVLIGGQDMTGVPPHKRDVNTVFQSYALFPHMTVQDNVAFGLRMKGVPAAQIRGGSCRRWSGSASRISPRAARISCPAGSGSGWRWRAPS